MKAVTCMDALMPWAHSWPISIGPHLEKGSTE